MGSHTADYKNGGTLYAEPEWVKAGTSNPITHTKDANITVQVVVTVQPSGIPFTLEGSSADDFLTFDAVADTSTGTAQTVSLTSKGKLANEIKKVTGSIAWKVKVGSSIEVSLGSSGAHAIYVTVGTPSGSDVTQWRINNVVTACSGESAPEGAIEKLQGIVLFDLSNNIDQSDEALWQASTGIGCDCISQVKFFILGLKMLGFPSTGSVAYVIPQTGQGAKVVYEPWDNSKRARRASDGALLGYYDRFGGTNRFEATLEYGGRYYFGGGTGSKDTPLKIMQAVCERTYWNVAPNPPQAWPFEVEVDWPGVAPEATSWFYTP